MRGVEKVLEDLQSVRKRMTKLDSLGYIEHTFFGKVQPKVLELCKEFEGYVEREDRFGNDGEKATAAHSEEATGIHTLQGSKA